jgi:glutamate dehydrogenase (NAD(P)+)
MPEGNPSTKAAEALRRRQPILLSWDESPARQQSLENFVEAAEILELDENIATRLRRPEKIIIVSIPVRKDDSSVEVLTGYRVQHNDSRGPYKGGIRYHPRTDLGEIAGLAMQMTDPIRLSATELQNLTRRYTAELLTDIGPGKDIPAPDMGTNEQTMAWIMDTFSQHAGGSVPEVVTGKPADCGGSAMRREATGRGVVYCIEEAAEEIGLELKGATFAVHGFGNVGSVVAADLVARGAKCIAVADVSGGYVRPEGIDLAKIKQHLAEHRTLEGFNQGDRVEPEEVLVVPCDLLVPAATGQVITGDNAASVQCKILAEGANAPTMPEADRILLESDTLVIPDILCNAGGVTVSYFEWVQGGMRFFWSASEIDARLHTLMKGAYHEVRKLSGDRGLSRRMAALCLGITRVHETMRRRGLYA